jgi:hypothetical protein
VATAKVPDRTAAHRRSAVLRLFLLAASAAVGYLLLTAGTARADDKAPAPTLNDVTAGLSSLAHKGPSGPGGAAGGGREHAAPAGGHAVSVKSVAREPRPSPISSARKLIAQRPRVSVTQKPTPKLGTPPSVDKAVRTPARTRPHSGMLRPPVARTSTGRRTTPPTKTLRATTARLAGAPHTAPVTAPPQAATAPVNANLPTVTAPPNAALQVATAPASATLPTTSAPVSAVLNPVTTTVTGVVRPVTALASGPLMSVTATRRTAGTPVTAALEPVITTVSPVLQRAAAPVSAVLQPAGAPLRAVLQPLTTLAPARLRSVPAPIGRTYRPYQLPARTGHLSAPVSNARPVTVGSPVSPLAGAPTRVPAARLNRPATTARPAAAGTNADTPGAPRDRLDKGDAEHGTAAHASRRTVPRGPAPQPVDLALMNSSAAAGVNSAPGAWATTSAVCLPAPAPLGTVALEPMHRKGRGVSRAPLPG